MRSAKLDKPKDFSVWRHYYRAVGSQLLGNTIVMTVIYLLSVVAGSIIAPLFYKGIIDSLALRDHAAIMQFFWFMLAANACQLGLGRLYEHANGYILSRSMAKTASYSLSKLTEHSYQFFVDHFAGSLVNKARKFVNAYEQMSDILITEFLYAAVTIVGIVIILCKTSLTLASAAIGWFIIFALTLYLFTKKRLPLEKQRGEIESKVTGVLSDIITNVLNLKIFSSKKKEEKYFDGWLESERRTRLSAWRYAEHMYSAIGLITLLAQSSLVILSVMLWRYGAATPGTIVLVMSYSGTLFMRLSGLGSAVRRFFDAYTNASEFADLLNKNIEIKDVANPEHSRISLGQVEFDSVDFAYRGSRKIFSKLNLKIEAGEKIGIVGTSGAGKTTITKLLLRFADITGGSLKIDGQDIRSLTQDDLRKAIAYVPQDPVLFHRTLRENIAYAKPAASQREIEDAAKLAHAHDFIQNLTYGYDTLVGERGIKLSGGERQRVAIARAILKNAPILILDEATSSLDSVSETHIKEALDTLMQGRTTIVIAHRLSTIEKMDRIIVMEDGKIVEEGKHKALLTGKGIYHNFWKHQNGGFIK